MLFTVLSAVVLAALAAAATFGLKRRLPLFDFAHTHAFPLSATFIKFLRPRSYSQKGQDLWLVEFLQGRRGGYFVDLGASNGVISNNSFLLERTLGWRGLCIEADPFFFRQLVRHRQCTCVQACVDRDAGQVDFTFKGATGGIVAPDTDNPQAAAKAVVPTQSLRTLLEENRAPAVIDYLSLDTEGAETRILLNFDFTRFRFLVMTIERPSAALHAFLIAQDYTLVKHDGLDGYYVHRTLPHLTARQT
jgi:FkbM family methyltransferase